MKKFKKVRAQRAKKTDPKLTWWQKNEVALEKFHPELATVWSDLKLLPVIKPIEQEQPDGLSLKLLPFQKEGLYWMLQQEKGPWMGGMLADEMGMGKTIQTIALILSDYNPQQRKHTLILAPTVAIMQWRNEFNKFTSGMKVCVWHGGNRVTDTKELLKYDIIMTSYAVLESSFRRQNTGFKRKGELIKEESVLHKIDWHRVILDEAHNIKDRSCNTARGAFALQAKFKWCLSGTPLQNR
jgi:DNA repair protein RAD16